MDKSVFDNLISTFDSVGIKKYVIRVEGGNRNIWINKDEPTTLVYSKDDGLDCISATIDTLGDANGDVDFYFVYWGEVQSVKAIGLTIKQAIDLADALGDNDSDFEDFIQHVPVRMTQIISEKGSVAGQKLTDDNGNTILPNGMSGMVL